MADIFQVCEVCCSNFLSFPLLASFVSFANCTDQNQLTDASKGNCNNNERNCVVPESSSSNIQKLVLQNSSLVLRDALKKRLKKHEGCVNTIQWSQDGECVVTGSDDCRVVRSLD